MREISYTVYYIEEHPDKEKCYEWMRDNLHDLSEHERDDFVDSLKKLHQYIGGTLDYEISVVPSRGEFIRFSDYDREELRLLSQESESCPLTGCFWDTEVIECLVKDDMRSLIRLLHETHEYCYTDEALLEVARSSNWEFTLQGARFNSKHLY